MDEGGAANLEEGEGTTGETEAGAEDDEEGIIGVVAGSSSASSCRGGP